MGQFVSEFALISKSHLMYSQIFEIKDPLFLLSGALIFSFFGIQGVFLFDYFLILFSSLLTFKISRYLNLSFFLSFVLSLIFLLTLTGEFYSTLRSTLFAIVIMQIFFLLLFKEKFTHSGFASAIVGGLKMPFLIILLSALPMIYYSCTKNKDFCFLPVVKMASGFFLGSVFILLCVYFYSDLNSYFEMIKINFRYASIYQDVSSMPNGIHGHILAIKKFKSNFYHLSALFILMLGVYLKISNRLNLDRKSKYIIFSLFLCAFLTLSLIAFMTMFFHHLHILVFFSWSIVFVLFIVYTFQKNKETINLFFSIKKYFIYLFSAILVIYMMFLSGFSVPNSFKQPISFTLFPSFMPPKTIFLLDNLQKENSTLPKTFARLGANDDLGLAAFMDSDWKFSCKLYAQLGFDNFDELEKLYTCIANDVSFIIITKKFESIKRRSEAFNQFRESVLLLVDETFSCEVPRDYKKGIDKVCVKKLIK